MTHHSCNQVCKKAVPREGLKIRVLTVARSTYSNLPFCQPSTETVRLTLKKFSFSAWSGSLGLKQIYPCIMTSNYGRPLLGCETHSLNQAVFRKVLAWAWQPGSGTCMRSLGLSWFPQGVDHQFISGPTFNNLEISRKENRKKKVGQDVSPRSSTVRLIGKSSNLLP